MASAQRSFPKNWLRPSPSRDRQFETVSRAVAEASKQTETFHTTFTPVTPPPPLKKYVDRKMCPSVQQKQTKKSNMPKAGRTKAKTAVSRDRPTTLATFVPRTLKHNTVRRGMTGVKKAASAQRPLHRKPTTNTALPPPTKARGNNNDCCQQSRNQGQLQTEPCPFKQGSAAAQTQSLCDTSGASLQEIANPADTSRTLSEQEEE